jgi:hypothetical protein
MKISRQEARCKARSIPVLRFEDQKLTSFSGLVLFQQLFSRIDLKQRLSTCFRHLRHSKVFGLPTIFLQLVVHLLMGFRELRDGQHYQDDPLVKRLLGLSQLPDTATISRTLKDADAKCVDQLRHLLRQMVLGRMRQSLLTRITLDFDGSVQSTGKYAEGTAVGFNKKKKGARSYYPLFCTVAQTGQVFDFLHRPGNVHDSNGAREFLAACIQRVREDIPWHVQIEVRMDSAFFSDEIVGELENQGVEFSISVPFERFVELKQMVEGRQRWHRLGDEVAYFESEWKPRCWNQRFRFLFIRTRNKQQRKEPVQLDLFVPHEYGYEFKVIVTNKNVNARAVVAYHEGRGSQEGLFAELKTHCHVDYVPTRRLIGNQLYLLAGLFAHNLTRELQMATTAPARTTTPKRAALWVFPTLQTLRLTVLQRAGRLTKPRGVLTLTISANKALKERFLRLLAALQIAA